MNFSQYTFGSVSDTAMMYCHKCDTWIDLEALDGNDLIGVMIKHSASKKCKRIAKETAKGNTRD